MGNKVELATLLTEAGKILSGKDLQKMVFGTYSDGKPRSLFDAMNGEVLSPKQKKSKLYKKRKSGKKKIRL